MEFYVNGNKIDITIENEKTIGDVLRSFEEECAKHDATTITIFVDETQVLATNFDMIASQPLKDDTKIELGVVSQADVIDALKQEAAQSRSVAEAFEQLPMLFQSNKDKEANDVIKTFTDLFDSICHTYSLSTLFPDLHTKIVIDGKNFAEFFTDISSVLPEFEQALKAKDTVLVGDLAEYELSPRLIAFADTMEQQK